MNKIQWLKSTWTVQTAVTSYTLDRDYWIVFTELLGANDGGGHWLVRMEWRPAGWSVCLPLVNLPLHHKVQKFSSGTGSPGWSKKKGHKTVVVVVTELLTVNYNPTLLLNLGPPEHHYAMHCYITGRRCDVKSLGRQSQKEEMLATPSRLPGADWRWTAAKKKCQWSDPRCTEGCH